MFKVQVNDIYAVANGNERPTWITLTVKGSLQECERWLDRNAHTLHYGENVRIIKYGKVVREYSY